MAYLALASRLTIALVFAVALAAKLPGREPVRELGRTLADIGLPRRLVGPTVVGVITAELAVVAAAPWPSTGTLGSVVAAVLLVGSAAGVSRAVRRHTTTRCLCFGGRRGRLSRFHVVRNAMLAAIATLGAVLTALSDIHSIHPPTTRRAHEELT